jgi:cytoskeletal protein RodZ
MPSFGEELRRERELRQISLREVSESTKIPLRYLDALENNDFTHLPGGVFNKGFVRAFSEFIGIDPEAMVNAYLLEERSQDDRGDEARRPVPRHAATAERETEPREHALGARRTRVAVVVAVAVVAAMAAAGLLWYWLGTRPEVRSGAASPAAAMGEARTS